MKTAFRSLLALAVAALAFAGLPATAAPPPTHPVMQAANAQIVPDVAPTVFAVKTVAEASASFNAASPRMGAFVLVSGIDVMGAGAVSAGGKAPAKKQKKPPAKKRAAALGAPQFVLARYST